MRAPRAAVACLVLSLIGIGLAGYLTFLHIGLMRGELLGGAVCGGSGVLNCHVVTGSAFSSVLGIPLALWGLIGYIVVIALALLARQSPEWASHALALIMVLALLFVAIDAVLLVLMAFVIRYFCLFCLATYAVNLSLLVVAARSLGRPWIEALQEAGDSVGTLWPSEQRPVTWFFWAVVLLGVTGVMGLHAATTFVSRGTLGSVQKQIREFVSKQTRVALDVTGDPMLGNPKALLQIVEFSDFLCPSCQRASKMNPVLLANHRNDAVFVFKHFPLDTMCNDKVSRMVHPGACHLAAASECAHLQGKFWPFHDRIFEAAERHQTPNVETIVRELGLNPGQFQACMSSGQGMAAVKRDIADAAKVNVTSTPTYVVGGIPVPGGFTPRTFEDFVSVLKETR
ncbi:MAG: vitamin K epoxide reductase family protein [Candidatus Omnitrophota bacterium]|nr:vitamin K epoxide reductase family protein [Candidatus Omnitrophota bacterium]